LVNQKSYTEMEIRMEINKYNLIDLIYEKQIRLLKKKQDKWNAKSSIPIKNTEWSILTLIYGKQPTISEIAQQVGITRQAAHKSIRTLDAKGLIDINPMENNNRNKCIKLTDLGVNCVLENQKLKDEIEKEISQEIGQDNIELLKNILKRNWD